MNKYIILLTILLTHQGFGTNAVKKLYTDPPEKISLNEINQTITEYNKNIEIANYNKYQIQKLRVYLLSFSPLLVHGIYRINKNLKQEDISTGKTLGSVIESFIGFAFTINGIKIKGTMWREEYERKSAISNCVNLYNSITIKPAANIKEIKAY